MNCTVKSHGCSFGGGGGGEGGKYENRKIKGVKNTIERDIEYKVYERKKFECVIFNPYTE